MCQLVVVAALKTTRPGKFPAAGEDFSYGASPLPKRDQAHLPPFQTCGSDSTSESDAFLGGEPAAMPATAVPADLQMSL